MKTQTAQSAFPTALLTFSVMLLVLAIGFVLGRVVVARRYLGSVPRVSAQGLGSSELDEGQGPPGHIYVPSPVAVQPDETESRRSETEHPPDEGESTGEERAAATPQEPKATASEDAKKQNLGDAEKPPPAEPVEEPSDKTYSIQVGVFANIQGARQVMGDLTRAGYPSRVSREKRGSEEIYRVVTGRYRSEYAARKALEQLRNEGFDAFLLER